jgi:hypothetical protein
MQAWNFKFGPELAYLDPRQFARDYNRARKAIVFSENNKWFQCDQDEA